MDKNDMKRSIIILGIFFPMVIGLPMMGLVIAGRPIAPYLEIPPRTQYVAHAPFSWPVFGAYAIGITALVFPLVLRAIKGLKNDATMDHGPHPFPWWGWGGILLGLISWTLAWTRFSWFCPFQHHTFTPLWLAYIITINALAYRRSGHCLMIDRTALFLFLFPVSALFWWIFEYLNRFVQNWYYLGGEWRALEYICYATIPFSTVLPAVMGTMEWVTTWEWPSRSFRHFLPLPCRHPKAVATGVIILATGGLTAIGIFPNHLFPLLWISPLLMVVALQTLFGKAHILSDIRHGNWHPVIAWAVAALICGFFWEMWNIYSLAKWRYSIPFVDRFRLFEMPILGYAGYLPFGLECAVISRLIADFVGKGRGTAIP
jgi:hypothetical protein